MSSNVIIDNSTLSAVQRITGNARVPKNYSIEGDYSAFENFLSTLLFYDTFYAVDDYKDEFRSDRKSQFSYVRHIPTSAFPYQGLQNKSVEINDDLVLEIKAGNITKSALTDFLEVMGLTLTAAWHLQSSDFFLTLKVLSDSPDEESERYKYSPLTSMIFNQLRNRTNTEINENGLYLESSDGEEISFEGHKEDSRECYVEQQLKDFSNSLNWLSRRATFYMLTSSHFDAAFCMHPIRHNFINSLAQEKNLFSQSSVWRDNFRKFFGDSAGEAVNAVNKNTEATEIGLQLPLLAAWAVGKTGSASKAIDAVLDLRIQPEALKLRRYMNELDEARLTASKKDINRLFSAIDIEKNTMGKKYGIQMDAASSVSIRASLFPDAGLSIAKPMQMPDLGLKFGPAKYARSIFRNVVNDIANFPNLGVVRGRLLKEIIRNEDEREPILRIEERRYRFAKPEWKKPM
ncbi:MAG: hypothetical protein AAGC95_01820 [Pseudomonadota bacterium]